MERSDHPGTPRAAFLRGVAAVGAGVALPGAGTRGARGATEGVQEARHVLGALLTLERLTTTLYYGALTAPAVMRNPALAGPSGNPHTPAAPPRGNPQQVRFLQAALDADAKHGAALERVGASSPAASFYFPAATFQDLGSSLRRASVLGLIDLLETICIGAYAAAAVAFIGLGRPDLAQIAAQIMGVESEHRTLGRVIGRVSPANDHTLETAPFAEVDEALRAIAPFLTGRRYLFASDTTRATAVPAPAEVARVVGNHGTRLVLSFPLTLKGGQ